MQNRIGQFDSWNIKSDTIAVKKCDKSFFDYNGSGIPSEIRWFFEAENLENGESQQIALIYDTRQYTARITKEKSDLGRTRIFWDSELGDIFKAIDKNTQTCLYAQFEKDGKNKFIITINELGVNSNDILKPAINKFINGYSEAKQEIFKGNPFGIFVRNEIPEVIYNTNIVDRNLYLITGSVGQGNWAAVPWICIFDRSITTSATKGVYIVYLLAKDGQSLYLTLNQGCTDIRSTHSKKDTIKIMRERAAKIVQDIDSRGFLSDEDINLGEGLTELAELYQKGIIFYKEYKKGLMPSESELQDDLSKMMQVYQDYVHNTKKEKDHSLEDMGGEEEVTTKQVIRKIEAYILKKGFNYESGMIENLYLSLKAKPFVILAGTSGTGKTRLVKLFAEAVGATSENGRYKMISVRPDWSDSSDLFGHVDLSGQFVPGALIDFVKQAESDKTFPYFLCLDEMNLARVEYYLSDVLSVIETRDREENGEIITAPLVSLANYGMDDTAMEKYGVLQLPENLYIIGTVNMDETTFPFSRKVLDRANTIEFSYVDLMPKFGESDEKAAYIMQVPNTFFKTEYLLLAQCKDEAETVQDYCLMLQEMNEILKQGNAHVGYRVRDEIVFYLLNNKKAELLDENEAFDNELMQKILPRIQGSSLAIKRMLCDLFKFCAGDFEGYQVDDNNISSKMFKVINKETKPRFKKSAEKIAFMVRRYEEDGFTAYWI